MSKEDQHGQLYVIVPSALKNQRAEVGRIIRENTLVEAVGKRQRVGK